MLMSHKKKFIFIHIYKTAGTSVMDVFLAYARLADRVAYDFAPTQKLLGLVVDVMGWHDDGMRQFTGFHKHAQAHEIRDKLGASVFDTYYRFAFVRNPFDFVVSLYYYMRQDRAHRHHSLVEQMSFLEFVRAHVADEPPRQIDFVTDPQTGQSIVDFVGRVETLDEDVAAVQRHLNLEPTGPLGHKNPSLNRRSRDYRDYYDEESRRLVERYFRADLDEFGYSYDDR